MKRFASLLPVLLVIALASCEVVRYGDLSSLAASDEFSVEVTADQSSYSEGDVVEFAIEICNLATATTTAGGGGSDIPTNFEVLDQDGAVIADDSHETRTMERRVVPWGQDQCRTARGSWDQHFWNRPEDRPSEWPDVYGELQRGEVVPHGYYRVRVTSVQGTATSASFELLPPD
jgi:hypothetical protein